MYLKKPKIKLLFLLAFTTFLWACESQEKNQNISHPPSWAADAVWYQIFVERFNNGDPLNDPTADDIAIPFVGFEAPANWQISNWTGDWYAQESWFIDSKLSFKDQLQFRRYGGDLQGIIDKLDYLQALGVNAIYLNPINHAPSLHKYDASSYHHVDANFGPDPAGDMKIMQAENPADPKTWQWTTADKLFLKLIDELHQRKMRIILDYSWNHTGTRFWAWEDVVKNQEKSAYKDWYEIKSFDNPSTPENEFSYEGWLNIPTLPEWKKTNLKSKKKAGMPYEGNLHEGVKAHIFEVSKRWLAPDGDTSKGIDGFRLDVADHIGMQFWRDYHGFVKNIKKDAMLIGEIWWKTWPDQLMNPLPYLKGNIFDAVMHYQVYRPARYFFAETDYAMDANALSDSLAYHWKNIPEQYRNGMMNVNASHDSPRLLSDFYNPLKYKFKADPQENPTYKTEKPDTNAEHRAKLYLIHQFTTTGAPHIWNGDEMGMWGADDPFNRKPLMWPRLEFDKEHNRYNAEKSQNKDNVKFNETHFEFYKKIIAIRNSNPVLRNGNIEIIQAEGKSFAYRRFDESSEILVYFNLANQILKIELPYEANYVDLLNENEPLSGNISLNYLSAKILKKSK